MKLGYTLINFRQRGRLSKKEHHFASAYALPQPENYLFEDDLIILWKASMTKRECTIDQRRVL